MFRPDHVVKKTGKIHHSRLIPRRHPETKRLETSVCRSQRLDDRQVWGICTVHFDNHAPKPATGRCVGPASAVYNVGLTFDPDGVPYFEHANIVGWRDTPGTPDPEQKHFWVDQAQRMAPQFEYLPRTVPPSASIANPGLPT